MLEFKENQKFTQWWIWLLLIGIGIIPFWGLYKQVVKGVPYGENPMSNVGLISYALIMIGFLTFFYLIKLKTTINKELIRISFLPFLTKSIHWKDIQHVEVITYGFVVVGEFV